MNKIRDKKGRFKKYKENGYCQDCNKVLCRYGNSIRCKSCTNKYYNALGLRGMKGKTQSEHQKQTIKERLTIFDWKECKPYMKEGYYYVSYMGQNVPLHHLIFCEYHKIPNIPLGYVIHHINENKIDNRVENLQMMTQSKHAEHHWKMRRAI
jgi:hypothetical protein